MSIADGDPVKPNLNSELANKLRQAFEKSRNSVHELCILASQIRSAHLVRGKRDLYTFGFTAWWRKNKLDETFGTISNFTKYALAGDTIERLTRLSIPASSIPASRNALYELRKAKDAELQDMIQTKETVADGNEPFLITSAVTAEQVRAHTRMHSQEGAVLPAQPEVEVKSQQPENWPIVLEVMIDPRILAVDPRGTPWKDFTLEQANQIVEKVKQAIGDIEGLIVKSGVAKLLERREVASKRALASYERAEGVYASRLSRHLKSVHKKRDKILRKETREAYAPVLKAAYHSLRFNKGLSKEQKRRLAEERTGLHPEDEIYTQDPVIGWQNATGQSFARREGEYWDRAEALVPEPKNAAAAGTGLPPH